MNGFQASVRALNEKGGVNGRKINGLGEDTRYDAITEGVTYEKFVSQTPTLRTSGDGEFLGPGRFAVGQLQGADLASWQPK